MSSWSAKLDDMCRDCGWLVVYICCNDALAVTLPYSDWDWWVYCSNPCCNNHTGEGIFQESPQWILLD